MIFKKNKITFQGAEPVEAAEELLDFFQKKPDAKVDLAECTHMHAANLQVLLATKATITAWPQVASLATVLQNALQKK
jgi:hypothetical protein